MPIYRRFFDVWAGRVHDRIMNLMKKVRKEKADIITQDQYATLLSGIASELEESMKEGISKSNRPCRDVYKNTYAWIGAIYGISIALDKPDYAAIKYFHDEYFPPMFKRLTIDPTPYNYKNTLYSILNKSVEEHWNWQKTIRNFESYLSSKGKNFPRWQYERIIRTETRRFVSEAHIRAHIKLGVKSFRRLEIVDDVTNPECVAFNNWLYPANEASGIIPWHPNCRGCMCPEPDKEGKYAKNVYWSKY